MTAHLLDTGLLVAQRTMIRDGIVAELAPLLKVNGLYVATLAKLSGVARGPGDDDGLFELHAAMTGPCPFIGVALGRGVGTPNGISTTADRALKIIDVHVYCASDNKRGRLARLAQDVVSAGDADADPVIVGSLLADPGIEIMMQHVEQILHGFVVTDPVNGTIHGLKFVDEEELWHAADRTIWAVRYTTEVESNSNSRRNVTAVLTAIRTMFAEANAPTQNPLITSDVEIVP